MENLNSEPLTPFMTAIPSDSSPPLNNKKIPKKIFLFLLLFFLISLPLIIFFLQRKEPITDIRNRAAVTSGICFGFNPVCNNYNIGDTVNCSGSLGICKAAIDLPDVYGRYPCDCFIIPPTPTALPACPIPAGSTTRATCVSSAGNNCPAPGYEVIAGQCALSNGTTGVCCHPKLDSCVAAFCGEGGCNPPMILIDVPASVCSNVKQCVCPGPGIIISNTPTKTPTPACSNPNGASHRVCQSNTCITVQDPVGTCDNETNNQCDTNAQCVSPTSPPNPTNVPTQTPTQILTQTPTPTVTNTPTPTRIIGQCLNIKIYRNGILINPNSLMAGENILIALVGTNATQARIKINNETNWRVSTTTNTSGEWTFIYQIPATGVNSFTIAGELFIGSVWQ